MNARKKEIKRGRKREREKRWMEGRMYERKSQNERESV